MLKNMQWSISMLEWFSVFVDISWLKLTSHPLATQSRQWLLEQRTFQHSWNLLGWNVETHFWQRTTRQLRRVKYCMISAADRQRQPYLSRSVPENVASIVKLFLTLKWRYMTTRPVASLHLRIWNLHESKLNMPLPCKQEVQSAAGQVGQYLQA